MNLDLFWAGYAMIVTCVFGIIFGWSANNQYRRWKRLKRKMEEEK